ncbi:cytochrome c-type biogenesis protein [Ideonella sp.]|uniref:cytochrome c-type biogenesis protein n=1 Tax=Ideonella sp. TaxID=1929293 RepID=UPI0035AFBA67
MHPFSPALRWLAVALLAAATALAHADEARPAADDPALEARMMAIAGELRCVVCQNQTIADSHAELAGDLRQQIRDQLRAGRSEDQIRAFMTDRYGDFVLYRPPMTARTALLWFGPGLLLAAGLGALVVALRRRSRLPADAFEEPDTASDIPPDTAPPAP